MRSLVLAVALLPDLLVVAPMASADPLPVWLKLSAYSGQPGGKVSIAAACDDQASPLTTEALDITSPLASNPDGHQPWALFAESVIRDVPQGSYPVSFHCGGDPVTVYFTVLAKEKPSSAPKSSTPKSSAAPKSSVVPKGKSQVSVVPKGAVQTGDGSSS